MMEPLERELGYVKDSFDWLNETAKTARNAPETYYLVVFFFFDSFVDMQDFWRKFLLAAYFDLIIIVASNIKYEGTY